MLRLAACRAQHPRLFPYPSLSRSRESRTHRALRPCRDNRLARRRRTSRLAWPRRPRKPGSTATPCEPIITARSEEHTSELQSPKYLVFRLLLEKKKKKQNTKEKMR